MKGVLSWLKSNVLVLIFAILIVVPLPVAWYFATGMNSSLKEGRQKEGQDALRKVQGIPVDYQLQPLTPTQEAISENTPPNAAMTEHFRAEQDRRLAQVEAVKASVVAYNQKDRGVLVEGLFPAPAGESQLRRNEMARRAVADDSPESAYGQLLGSMRVRPPVNPGELASLISVQRDRRVAEITGDQGEQALTPEQVDQINGEMLDLRISRYRTHARDTLFYGSLEVLPPSVPIAVPPAPPALDTCFAWQADYWLIDDVLAALADANARLDATGVGGNVIDGVVKRVDSIQIDPPPFITASGGNEFQNEGRNARQDDDGPSGANTLTGRAPLQSQLYDVRVAQLSLVVSSAKLPVLLDAIAASNFITVLDLDLYEIDPWDDLDAGYYFGEDAVVRAEIELEVLHLRDWTVPFMPESVKAQLGLLVETDDEG